MRSLKLYLFHIQGNLQPNPNFSFFVSDFSFRSPKFPSLSVLSFILILFFQNLCFFYGAIFLLFGVFLTNRLSGILGAGVFCNCTFYGVINLCYFFLNYIGFFLAVEKMDRYQRVEKPRAETPIDENEIRITSQGRMRNYITYAMTLLQVSFFSYMISSFTSLFLFVVFFVSYFHALH